jgi:hypothetical protein
MIDADIGWWYDLYFFGEVTDHLLLYFVFQRYPFAWRKLLERYLSLGGLTVLVVPEASRVKSEGRALICSTFKSLTSDSSCLYHGTGFSVIDINSHPKLAMA